MWLPDALIWHTTAALRCRTPTPKPRAKKLSTNREVGVVRGPVIPQVIILYVTADQKAALRTSSR